MNDFEIERRKNILLPFDSARSHIVIADIAGKGVSAGLFMPAVKIALRTNIQDETDLEPILRKTNQIIYELTDDERFASLFYAILDLRRAICRTSTGGISHRS